MEWCPRLELVVGARAMAGNPRDVFGKVRRTSSVKGAGHAVVRTPQDRRTFGPAARVEQRHRTRPGGGRARGGVQRVEIGDGVDHPAAVYLTKSHLARYFALESGRGRRARRASSWCGCQPVCSTWRSLVWWQSIYGATALASSRSTSTVRKTSSNSSTEALPHIVLWHGVAPADRARASRGR